MEPNSLLYWILLTSTYIQNIFSTKYFIWVHPQHHIPPEDMPSFFGTHTQDETDKLRINTVIQHMDDCCDYVEPISHYFQCQHATHSDCTYTLKFRLSKSAPTNAKVVEAHFEVPEIQQSIKIAMAPINEEYQPILMITGDPSYRPSRKQFFEGFMNEWFSYYAPKKSIHSLHMPFGVEFLKTVNSKYVFQPIEARQTADFAHMHWQDYDGIILFDENLMNDATFKRDHPEYIQIAQRNINRAEKLDFKLGDWEYDAYGYPLEAVKNNPSVNVHMKTAWNVLFSGHQNEFRLQWTEIKHVAHPTPGLGLYQYACNEHDAHLFMFGVHHGDVEYSIPELRQAIRDTQPDVVILEYDLLRLSNQLHFLSEEIDYEELIRSGGTKKAAPETEIAAVALKKTETAEHMYSEAFRKNEMLAAWDEFKIAQPPKENIMILADMPSTHSWIHDELFMPNKADIKSVYAGITVNMRNHLLAAVLNKELLDFLTIHPKAKRSYFLVVGSGHTGYEQTPNDAFPTETILPGLHQLLTQSSNHIQPVFISRTAKTYQFRYDQYPLHPLHGWTALPREYPPKFQPPKVRTHVPKKPIKKSSSAAHKEYDEYNEYGRTRNYEQILGEHNYSFEPSYHKYMVDIVLILTVVCVMACCVCCSGIVIFMVYIVLEIKKKFVEFDNGTDDQL